MQIQEVVLQDEGLTDLTKAKVLENLAAADKALVDGADESLQLTAVASGVQLALTVAS